MKTRGVIHSKMNGSNHSKNNLKKFVNCINVNVRLMLSTHFAPLYEFKQNMTRDCLTIQSGWDNTNSPVMYMNNKVWKLNKFKEMNFRFEFISAQIIFVCQCATHSFIQKFVCFLRIQKTKAENRCFWLWCHYFRI